MTGRMGGCPSERRSRVNITTDERQQRQHLPPLLCYAIHVLLSPIFYLQISSLSIIYMFGRGISRGKRADWFVMDQLENVGERECVFVLIFVCA